ncbi:MAG TPA: topoisomerase C-terminal repeat-containing protein, partial [Kiloniellales bacterium]|nr:topoisomerase C-terminal repeat-containing protein [Kiloniellales bacterium]
IPADEDVLTIGLNRAVDLLAQKQQRGASALKTLGEHPDGGEVTLHSGRYGPYVKHGKINATLPKGREPESITLEEALELIAARAAKVGSKSRKAAPKRKTAPRKKASG